MKIAIIGAGSIGANIALRLQKSGAQVVLVEARHPAYGTTGASFSWLSSFPQMSWKEDPGRASLRVLLHDIFDTLNAEIGGDWLHWTGTLTDARGVPELDGALAACRLKGVDVELLDAKALAELAPGLQLGPDARAVYESHSGWVDAPRMVARLVEAFVAAGGTLKTGVAVSGISRTAERVTGLDLSDGTHLDVDFIVNAAGSWGTHIAAMAGLALAIDLVPGVMIYAGRDRPGLPPQVVNGPDWLVRPDNDHGLAIHWRGESLTAVHGGNGSNVAAMVANIARHIPALAGVEVEDVRVGIRAIPHGGPIIGSLPWLSGFYQAISHGGVGWGPLWGEMAKRELLDGEFVPELASMRPERFYMEPQNIGRFADDAEQPYG